MLMLNAFRGATFIRPKRSVLDGGGDDKAKLRTFISLCAVLKRIMMVNFMYIFIQSK